MSVQYPDNTDYLVVAVAVTGLYNHTLLLTTKLDLADSALHAPSAGFSEHELYPDFVDKAAVLSVASGECDEARAAERLRALLVAPDVDGS